jgi:hypothetical protein
MPAGITIVGDAAAPVARRMRVLTESPGNVNVNTRPGSSETLPVGKAGVRLPVVILMNALLAL